MIFLLAAVLLAALAFATWKLRQVRVPGMVLPVLWVTACPDCLVERDAVSPLKLAESMAFHFKFCAAAA